MRRCWDGVNLDSPDHKSHVTYPENGSFERGSPCPKSHPVRLPQLFYEIMWNTTAFNNPAEWPEDGSQPFVLSTGDPYVAPSHNDDICWSADRNVAPGTANMPITFSAGRAMRCSEPWTRGAASSTGVRS